MFKNFYALLFVVAIFVVIESSRASEQKFARMVLGQTISTQVNTSRLKQQVKGSVNLHLSAQSENEFKKGELNVENLGVVLFNVQQKGLISRRFQGKSTGVVAFSATARRGGKKQVLKYNRRTNSLVGQISGVVDFPALAKMGREHFRSSKEDIFSVPTLSATLGFNIKLKKQLPEHVSRSVSAQEGEMMLTLRVARSRLYRTLPFTAVIKTPIRIDLGIGFHFETARRLCLQPVRVRANAFDASPTGDGLAFGLPGANTQWHKADITFHVRRWKTVTDSDLKVLTAGAEETELRGKVEDDDCIEIFFIENFSPESLHGGGATWGGGTASSQIITSDGNAVGGIDLTHLAHELGHVLGLHHPGVGAPNATWPNLIDGNTGTLMCPSGWMNDNPAFNSQGNKDNLSNPLLQFSIKAKSPGPDCQNNADCGGC